MMKPYYETHIFKTLGEALAHMHSAYGEKTALTTYSRGGKELTTSYRALTEEAAAFASALEKRGLLGKHIAIAAENSVRWLAAFLGITASGGVCVAVDAEQTAEAIAEMIRLSDAAFALVSEQVAEEVAKSLAIPVVAMDEAGELLTYDAFTSDEPRDADAVARFLSRAQTLTCDMPALIAFTSGTSGKPKAVLISQGALTTDASYATSMVRPTEKVFSPLPLYHTYGLSCGALCILFAGSNLGLNGDIKRMARDLVKFNAPIMMAVPLLVETTCRMLTQSIERNDGAKAYEKKLALARRLTRIGIRRPISGLVKLKRKYLGELTTIVSGGAHLSERAEADMRAFGITVLNGYGITECSPLISVNRLGAYKRGSAGQPLACTKVKLEAGEILVSSPTLMTGYYKDDEATREVMRNGYFMTGDMGRIDKHGFLFITGRKKNLIVFKNGNKLSPEEIEGYYRNVPLVREVVAFGAKSGESKDDVRLAVNIYPDPVETSGMASYELLDKLQRATDKINEKLPAYKQIQVINVMSGEAERTTVKNTVKREQNA